MAIDLLTGEHICMGLALGQGCASCREKYPHLLATTAEEKEAGARNIERAVAVYSRVLDGQVPLSATVVEDLNSFNYGGDNANRFEFVGPADSASAKPRPVQQPLGVANLRTRARHAFRILIGRD